MGIDEVGIDKVGIDEVGITHHPYLVCILFGMPSLNLFIFLMVFIFMFI